MLFDASLNGIGREIETRIAALQVRQPVYVFTSVFYAVDGRRWGQEITWTGNDHVHIRHPLSNKLEQMNAALRSAQTPDVVLAIGEEWGLYLEEATQEALRDLSWRSNFPRVIEFGGDKAHEKLPFHGIRRTFAAFVQGGATILNAHIEAGLAGEAPPRFTSAHHLILQ